MTVAGPLTTTFEAPSSCATATAAVYQAWSGTVSSYIQGPLFPSEAGCFPSGYNPTSTNYYSPGWCPSGYTTACSSLVSARTATETAVICCPTLFQYTCLTPTSTSPDQSQQPVLGCSTTFLTRAAVVLPVVTTLSNGIVGNTTVATETKGGITAYGIQVRFKSGDPTPASTTDGSNKPTSSPSRPLPVLPILPAETAPSSSSHGGVSTPAAIGIGVGSAVFALLAAGLLGLFFFLRWRRKKRASPDSSSFPSDPPPVPPKELEGSPVPYGVVPPPYELSEDAASPRRFPSIMSVSKRQLSSASPGSSSALSRERERERRGGRGDSDVLGYNRPAELEAEVPPSEASLRDRASPSLRELASPSLRDRASPSLRDRASPALRDEATPASAGSGWADRQARGGTQPSVWI